MKESKSVPMMPPGMRNASEEQTNNKHIMANLRIQNEKLK
jgi:hypothetical protein